MSKQFYWETLETAVGVNSQCYAVRQVVKDFAVSDISTELPKHTFFVPRLLLNLLVTDTGQKLTQFKQ
jgi:hypothetical protein